MPAKPRPAVFRRGRATFDRGLVDRDLLELARFDLVSPFSRRILFTVLAATSSARAPYRPELLALCLMCLYCRSRFGLAPRGISLPPWPNALRLSDRVSV